MAELTTIDIQIGRTALQQGLLTRPQLDAGVALVRGGQAPDLGYALVMAGSLTQQQLGYLQGALHSDPAGPPLPQVPPTISPDGGEAPTLHEQGGYGGYGGYGAAPMDAGGYGGFGAGPGSGGFAGPGSGGYAAPGSGGFAAPGSGGFAAPGGFGGDAYGGGGYGDAGYGAAGYAPPAPAPGFGGGMPGGFGTDPTGSAGYGMGPGSSGGYGGPGSSGGYGLGSSGGLPMQLGEMPSESAGQRIGDWVVEREIARGGMGVVYEVRNDAGERAALKVLLPQGGQISEKKLKRFQREIESSKKLDHPGIVKVIDSGQFNGYPFLVMEYMEGKGLDRLLKDDLDLEIGMEILETVARAVHYAHEQGIVHRDLKPANVLVTEDMKPRLTDFGLAKNKDHTSILTNSGSVLGTPYYLSPEQAQGHSKNIDSRADIYSLGVIMYELATGRLPFVGQTTVELYNRIIHDDPVPPTKFKPQLTKAFETVCLKAMSKNPADRYQTAAEFADDVQALLAGGTIAARGEGALGAALKNLRKRMTVGTVLALSGVLLVVAVAGVVGWHVHREKARRAQLVAQELQHRRDGVDEKCKLALAAVERGRTAMAGKHLSDALGAADEALSALDTLDHDLQTSDYPENRDPLTALADETAEQRKNARALALVLKARATMLSDENGAIEQAQRHLTTILEEVKPPESAVAVQLEVLLAQAELHVLAGKLDNALTEYKNAVKLQESSLRAQQGRIQVHLLLEEYEDVLPLIGQTLQRFTDAGQLEQLSEEQRKVAQAELLLQRAEVYVELEELKRAGEDLDAAQKHLPQWWRPRAVRARILAIQGRGFEARDELGEAVKAAGDEKAQAMVAEAEVLLLIRGAEVEAYERASAAASLDPSLLVAQVVKAEAAEAKLDTKTARGDAEAVELRAQPRDWRLAARAKRVPARLAAVAGDVKNIKEALDLAKKAHTQDEFSAQGRLLLARLQLDPTFEDQYLDSAERLFKQVAKQRQDKSLQAKRGQGLVLLARYPTEPQRAQLRLEEAMKLDKNDPWTLTALAHVYKETDLQRAERLWEAAARFERDVRRPEGLAYAQGLRQLRLGRRLLGKRRADHLDKAQEAFRRAVWLNPFHVQALTGLATIAHLDVNHRRADAFLKRALAHNPRSPATRLLQAQHACSRDVREQEQRAAQEAVRNALEVCPDAPELAAWQVMVKLLEGVGNQVDGPAALGPKLEAAYAEFDQLQKRDPWDLPVVTLERDLLQALDSNLRALPDEPKAALQARLEKLRELASRLGGRMDQQEKEAAALVAELEQTLADPDTIVDASLHPKAVKAARLAPWRADCWVVLSRIRAQIGDPWAALAAGVRAAWLDDAQAPLLFPLLRTAGKALQEKQEKDLTPYVERVANFDKSILPVHPDLTILLRGAPIVAQALTGAVDVPTAKATADALEAVIARRPTMLAPHALLGALYYGAEREDQAVQELLFMAAASENAGESYYLAAVAMTGVKGTSDAERDGLAVQMLQDATQSGFEWAELAASEPKLSALRQKSLWKRLLGGK